VGSVHNEAETTAQDHWILGEILAHADSLCRTQDPLLMGQYRHLRERIEALLELTSPLDSDEAIA
jgi:hypothetical protein